MFVALHATVETVINILFIISYSIRIPKNVYRWLKSLWKRLTQKKKFVFIDSCILLESAYS